MSASIQSVEAKLGRGKLGVDPKQHGFSLSWLVVLTESGPYNWLLAQFASGIPARSSTDATTGLCCVDVSSEPFPGDESGLNYIVTAHFADDPISASNLLPWLRKDQIEDSVKRKNYPMEQDHNNNPAINSGNPRPVVNAAGDKFCRPPTQELLNPYYRVRRFRQASVFDYANAKSCQNTVNSGSFTLNELNDTITIPAGGAVLHSIIAKPCVWYTPGGSPATVNYYDITFEVECTGQFPPLNPDISQVQLNNTGIFHYMTANTPASKVHGWNRLPDPNNPTNPLLHMLNPPNPIGAAADRTDAKPVVVPLTQDVFLNLDGTRATDLSTANLATLYLNYTQYPTIDWSAWMS